MTTVLSAGAGGEPAAAVPPTISALVVAETLVLFEAVGG